MQLPDARGPRSQWVRNHLNGVPQSPPDLPDVAAPLEDDDLHLALWLCYELHFQGFDDVPDDAEWDPELLAFRAGLEAQFLRALRSSLPAGDDEATPMAQRLRDVIAADDSPSLASALRRDADTGQFREFVVHRSIYHLKEADPHTFAIPRLRGAAKAAMVEIQGDEYGGGRPERMHSTLFAVMMTELGLDTTYGHYLDDVPGITLATNNLMSLFGLHRRWRGAAAGHLASIEMTSSAPNRRYAQALRRLGGTDTACDFFDEHVEADAVHEQIAAHDLCQVLAQDQPGVAEDIVFGARCALLLDGLFAEHVLRSWASNGSSLRSTQVPVAA